VVKDVFDTRTLCYTYVNLTPQQVQTRLPKPRVETHEVLVQPTDAEDADAQPVVVTLPVDQLARVSPSPAPATPTADDHNDLLRLRVPKPLPAAWAAMNNVPLDKLRQSEQAHAQLVHRLNGIQGFVSPSALWKRPDMLAKLAPTVQAPLHADVLGLRVSVDMDTRINPLQAVADTQERVKLVLPGGLDQLEKPASALQAEQLINRVI
jgi:hypothetical protein